MPDRRTRAGELNVTTGRTQPPPLTDGHEMPPMPHAEDLIADGHITERARLIATLAAEIYKSKIGSVRQCVEDAADMVCRAEEIDRHERLQAPPMKPLPPQRPAYVSRG